MVRVLPSHYAARGSGEGGVGSGQTGRHDVGGGVEVDGGGELQQGHVVGYRVGVVTADKGNN